jgi:hypothetical protein
VFLPRAPTDGKCENNPFFKDKGIAVSYQKEVTILFLEKTLLFLSFRGWMRSFQDLHRELPSFLYMLLGWCSIFIVSLTSCFLCLDNTEWKWVGREKKIVGKKWDITGNGL